LETFYVTLVTIIIIIIAIITDELGLSLLLE